MQQSPYSHDALQDLNRVLESEGIQSALAFLNARAPHRFTAVNLIQDKHMVCKLLHDKAGKLVPEAIAPVPMQHSFCQFVLRDGWFNTHDSGADARLAEHKYQGVVLSYCGVPLTDSAGELWGTLCHMDMREQLLPEEEFELFQRAARLLPKYLPRSR